jgi:hypothetical protein
VALSVEVALRGVALAAAELRPGPEAGEACCVFARRALELAGVRVDGAPIGLWHLWAEEGDPWGPVSAAIRCGAAAAPTLGQGVYLVQGWRGTPLGPGVSGHTFLVVGVGGPVGYVLDAAAGRSGSGAEARLVDLGAYLAQYRGGWRAARV